MAMLTGMNSLNSLKTVKYSDIILNLSNIFNLTKKEIMSEIKTADCMKRKENKPRLIRCKNRLAYMSWNNHLVTNRKDEVFGNVVDIEKRKQKYRHRYSK